MFRLWSEESRKEVVNIVGLLWTAMFFGWLELPENTTFPLFNFPLLVRPVFVAMLLCLGAFLFFQMISRLPVAKHTESAFSDHSLVWLALFPSISGLFWVLVA